MKGSAITGPVGKEAAELWPVSYRATSLPTNPANRVPSAYCQQLRCRHVKDGTGLASVGNEERCSSNSDESDGLGPDHQLASHFLHLGPWGTKMLMV
jgi:hypothetical protein